MSTFEISTLDYTALNEEFGIVSFNDLDLVVSFDRNWFCATRFYRSLKYDKNSVDSAANNWWKLTMKPKIEDNWPDLWKQIDGKGNGKCRGIYVHISLLNMIGYSIDAQRFQFWFMNESWNDVNKSGTLYLIQPAKFIGTNIIKVGESKRFKQRLDDDDYGKGTMVLGIVESNNRSKGEHHLKKLFDDSGAIKKNEIGNEYYEVPNLRFSKRVFRRIRTKIPELLDGEVLTFKEEAWIHGVNDESDEEDEE